MKSISPTQKLREVLELLLVLTSAGVSLAWGQQEQLPPVVPNFTNAGVSNQQTAGSNQAPSIKTNSPSLPANTLSNATPTNTPANVGTSPGEMISSPLRPLSPGEVVSNSVPIVPTAPAATQGTPFSPGQNFQQTPQPFGINVTGVTTGLGIFSNGIQVTGAVAGAAAPNPNTTVTNPNVINPNNPNMNTANPAANPNTRATTTK